MENVCELEINNHVDYSFGSVVSFLYWMKAVAARTYASL